MEGSNNIKHVTYQIRMSRYLGGIQYMPDVGENYGEIATFFFFSLVYLLIYGCIGSSLLRTGFL